MRLGIHLPQYGRASGGRAVAEAAAAAESLGYADVWVSDHVVAPVGQDYPSPHLYDPLVTLAWAGAVTETVGLGTSVLVAASHAPLELANALASLDSLTGGRLVCGVGVGWSEAEFDALDRSFHDRGARTDELLELLRACWTGEPVEFSGRFHQVHGVRILPTPARRIPVWIGGMSPAARRRGITRGDGFQLIGVTPGEAAPLVAELRAARPEPEFVISLRTGWDPAGMDPDLIARELVEYRAVGIDHVVAAPWRRDLDSWLASMSALAEIAGLGSR